MIDTSPRQKVEVRASESVPDDHNCDVGPTSTLQQPSPEHENGSSESSSMSCDDVTSSLSAEPGIKGESLLG
ncbi:hypothetical protein GCK32_017160 [Trichostrongylus colubriformis]|uniref:Uncharacterized protein n=1 Tax=Trichostrongylus colubriformis TaxID=6319 RepID=A0AAN8IDC6_TRICO